MRQKLSQVSHDAEWDNEDGADIAEEQVIL